MTSHPSFVAWASDSKNPDLYYSADIGNIAEKLRNDILPGDVDTDFLTVAAAATPSALSSGLSSGLSSSSLSLESLSSDDQTQSPASVRCNRPDWPQVKLRFFYSNHQKWELKFTSSGLCYYMPVTHTPTIDKMANIYRDVSNGWASRFEISFKIWTIGKPTSFKPFLIHTSLDSRSPL